jgi:hypothetical protein
MAPKGMGFHLDYVDSILITIFSKKIGINFVFYRYRSSLYTKHCLFNIALSVVLYNKGHRKRNSFSAEDSDQ